MLVQLPAQEFLETLISAAPLSCARAYQQSQMKIHLIFLPTKYGNGATAAYTRRLQIQLNKFPVDFQDTL